ncbi:hypothetical protein MAR_033507, partial [Mya arenaria]
MAWYQTFVDADKELTSNSDYGLGNTCRNGYLRGQICIGDCRCEVNTGRTEYRSGNICTDDCVKSCGRCLRDLGEGVTASCSGNGDAVSQCANGICTGLSFVATGTCSALSFLGQCCYEICSVQLLLHLFLPLCSMSISISSVVLPYWAWGETNVIAVGLFEYCNFTEENRISNQSECSSLFVCFQSDFKIHLLIKAASGLQITYIVLHVITILLATISQQKEDDSYDQPDTCQYCNGVVVLIAAAICYIGIIVFLSGVIQSHSFKGGPPRLSINLAMISCVLYLTYAAVCFGQPKVHICVPTSTAVVYLLIFMMTNKTVLIVVLVLIGTLIVLLKKCR